MRHIVSGMARLPQAVRRLRVAVDLFRSFSDVPDKPKRPKLVVFDLGGVVLQSPSSPHKQLEEKQWRHASPVASIHYETV